MPKKHLLTILLITVIVCAISLNVTNPAYAAGPVTHYTVTFLKTTYTQAMANNIIITAMDATETKVATYNGAVTLTCNDPHAILPTSTTIEVINGIATRSIYFGTPGDQTVTVTDTTDNTLTGTLTVTVQPISIVVSVYPLTVEAGGQVNVTATVVDASANVLTDIGTSGWGKSVNFTSTDTQAIYLPQGLPRNLINGTGVYNVTLNTVGTQTITVSIADFPLVNATTASITVQANATATVTPAPTTTPTASPTNQPTATQTATVTPTPQTINALDNTTLLISVIIVVVVVSVLAAVLFVRKKQSGVSGLPPPPPP